MKNVRLILVGLIFFVGLSFSGNAQNKILDKPWIKENTPTRRVIPYTQVREADVMWHRRIWRTIDLREKINHPLYYPISPIADRKSLFDVIKEGVSNGELTAYDFSDDEFAIPLTKSEAVASMGDTITVYQEDEYGDPSIEVKTYEEVGSVDIIAFRLKEDWFFDRERSMMDVRIMGICPVKNLLNDDGSVRGPKPLFWIYFPEARYVFANYDVFNRQNEAEKRTYEDIFWKRMFNSYITKRSNVYDRSLPEYKTALDLLLEAEKIKEDLFIMEHDLWHY